ncbi:hypothetical protein J0B02_00350 [Enterobacteriaceae bacterium YMB-R22]|jgi:allophanate hydrolase subunit 2|uniref:hypothetical protein n=1 Tax=Tenebrionicola larvae TaxID=2815733 RepID=UPI002012A751|nr:hypothetical protein [Tenebrionicola larvae]MBV4411308.1 hypothetical protein [Tenebrionicola larvae]
MRLASPPWQVPAGTVTPGGGYPGAGAVVDYHLDFAGQIPPGAVIRLRVIASFREIMC